jgi:uncharacterized protein (TIGR03083 family)
MRAYGAEKALLTALVRELDEGGLAKTVPACPDWSVRDLLAHLVGTCQAQAEDTSPPEAESDFMKILIGWNEPARTAARNRWAGEMVTVREGASVEDLLEEWDRWEKASVATVNRGGLSSMRLPWLVSDLVTHAQDVRGAVGRPGEPGREAGQLALKTLLFQFDIRVTATELPVLRVVDADGKVLSGKSGTGATLSGTRHELLRAFAGRRSLEQIRPMLSGEGAEYYVVHVPLYDPPAEPLVD